MVEFLRVEIFKENRFRGLISLVKVFALLTIGLLLILSYTKMPENYFSLQEFLLLALGLFVSIIIFTFFRLSFQPRKTITCTSDGIEIQNTTFWSNSGDFVFIRWYEISDTQIFEIKDKFGKDIGTINLCMFNIIANNKCIELFDLKYSNAETAQSLISCVNNSTPHLNYIWIPDSKSENQLLINHVHKFCKIIR